MSVTLADKTIGADPALNATRMFIMLARLLRGSLYSLVGVALLIYLIPWGLYFWGVQTLPEPLTSAQAAPPLLVDAYKLSLGESRASEFEPHSPWTLLLWISSGNSLVDPPEGSRLSGQAGRALINRGEPYEGKLHRHFREMAAAIWITRHWTADEAASTALQESYYGHRLTDLESASLQFFAMPAADLGPSEAAVLVALMKGPRSYRCSPERMIPRATQLVEQLAPGTAYAPRLAPGFTAGCPSD